VIAWRLARFEDLTAREIHDLFQARAAVFVVEQNCAFQDLDGVDPECWHLLGHQGTELVA
jgi:ElaA protein